MTEFNFRPYIVMGIIILILALVLLALPFMPVHPSMISQ